jgi:hypothetical protein
VDLDRGDLDRGDPDREAPDRGAADRGAVTAALDPMRPVYRVRLVVNAVNGSTFIGMLVAAAGRARLTDGADGLFVAERYRLPVPAAPAFCLGNVILTRMHRDALIGAERLLAHEARHATQYAWCAGPVMLPLYFAAAGLSWALTGDFGSNTLREPRRRRLSRPAAAAGPGPVAKVCSSSPPLAESHQRVLPMITKDSGVHLTRILRDHGRRA